MRAGPQARDNHIFVAKIFWDQRDSKKRRGNWERSRGGGTGWEGDTNTGLMTSCAAVAHECVEGEMEESGVVLGGLEGGGLSSPSPPKPIAAKRRDARTLEA